ncbi:Transposase [Singulisphaera sp. GP187]|uniref:IS630 family transposase n=1 Tax=Singulisphaera sp. GP187 TaxID=1882752 RepID=UPI00092A524E|nr:IS630 family transposase [Singulisphaera sp. GP187]SIN84043.1 Transposase [Singulisphaera sp. GP187]SIN98240.1 Transposase [Singulisphaera sp. GP187]SIO11317.1 Transposase [Singulisphaera sp. GP187]SIO18983.1 Transposase [Singulisphaera sp. GP187]SIO29838.1 Transposase [Singulisphaera sp. GP187]
MPGQAAKITITECQQEILRTLSRATTAPSRLRQRASIILMGFDGLRNQEIAEAVGLVHRQVGRWRRRWANAWEKLINIECCETRAKLRHAIEAVLTDEPRPGAPSKFTPEQVTQILAIACEPPEKSGRPITHWTARELADEVVKRGIVVSISSSQVSRYLDEAALQPHKSRYWLNTTEKDPQRFEEQVKTVCDTYLMASERERNDATHTVCIDEMTGLQALERIAPTKGMIAEKCERIEFEYIRHGTLCLIGNFEVTTGKMLTQTIGPTRTEADFVRHIEQTLTLDPEGSWVFIADNLNIHCTESLVNQIAVACEIPLELGKKGKRGVLKSVASRQAFLSDTSHRIRFVYLPKHSSWLNQIEVIFGVIMRKVIRRGSFTSVNDLQSKLLNFLTYFNKVFAKPFRWTYTGRPLMKSAA